MTFFRPQLLFALATALLVHWWATPVHAATVAKVNKEQDKVIIALSQSEMAALSDDDEVVVEFGKEGFVTFGSLSKLNPVKQTVVLTVETPDDRFAAQQPLRFLSVYWNAPYSPVIGGYSQFHQYSRSWMDAGFGGVGGQVTSDLEGDKATFKYGGTNFRADGYLLFSREWFGIGMGFDRYDLAITDGGVTSNTVRPGMWTGVEAAWRLGLRYDYTALEYELEDDNDSTFVYELGAPLLDVTHFDAGAEYGLRYKHRAAFTAVDTITFTGGSVDFESPLKQPAQLDIFGRWVASPLYVWGLGLGYLFFERELDDSLPLRTKPKIYELLRLNANFEHRLSDGDKFDWQVYFDGAKAVAPHGGEKGVNSLGWRGAYQVPFGVGHIAGLSGYVEGGVNSEDVDSVDPATGEGQALTREYKGFAYGMMLFVHYELDLTEKKRLRP